MTLHGPARVGLALGRVELEVAELEAADVRAADGLGVHQVRDAEEVGDEDGRRLLVDLARRRHLLDPAVGHDGDPVAHRERLLLVVGHVDERDPDLLLERLQLDLERLSQLGVEGAERLVEEQHRGLQDERPRERDALLLAARHLRRACASRSR